MMNLYEDIYSHKYNNEYIIYETHKDEKSRYVKKIRKTLFQPYLNNYVFILYNPSHDYYTISDLIKKIIESFDSIDFNEIVIINLFDYISSKKKNVSLNNISLDDNNYYLQKEIEFGDNIIFAYGDNINYDLCSIYEEQINFIKALCKKFNKNPLCYKINKSGNPRHIGYYLRGNNIPKIKDLINYNL